MKVQVELLRFEERIAADRNFGIGPAISPSRMPSHDDVGLDRPSA